MLYLLQKRDHAIIILHAFPAGEYVQTKKWVDDQLMDQVLSFLDRRAADNKPFFTYYAPHAIHT
jgi:hypothetical protein